MSKFHILLRADEDGNPLQILTGTAINDVLDYPADYGVTDFHNASWLGDNKDPNYWGDGDAVLLECEVVVPIKPKGFVLP